MAETKQNKPTLAVYMQDQLTDVNDALPKDFNKAKFVQNSIAVLKDIKANQKIDVMQKFGVEETMQGLFKGAFLGLDFFSKECYLIPYGQQLQFQIDYRGAKKLAKNYSIRPIKDISAEIVRDGDTFEKWIEDGQTKFKFIPKMFNQGKILGAFAYVLFEDGGTLVDVMSLDELEVTRSKSKMAQKGAWKDFTNEMYKKTVLHRLCKQVELDFENTNQRNLFDEDVAIETDPEEIVKADVEKANTVEFKEVKVQEPKAEKVEETVEEQQIEIPEVFNYEN